MRQSAISVVWRNADVCVHNTTARGPETAVTSICFIHLLIFLLSWVPGSLLKLEFPACNPRKTIYLCSKMAASCLHSGTSSSETV